MSALPSMRWLDSKTARNAVSHIATSGPVVKRTQPDTASGSRRPDPRIAKGRDFPPPFGPVHRIQFIVQPRMAAEFGESVFEGLQHRDQRLNADPIGVRLPFAVLAVEVAAVAQPYHAVTQGNPQPVRS